MNQLDAMGAGSGEMLVRVDNVLCQRERLDGSVHLFKSLDLSTGGVTEQTIDVSESAK
jgi:hypothetical protein